MFDQLRHINYKQAYKTLAFKVGMFIVFVMAFSLFVFSFVFVFFAQDELKKDILINGQTFANFSTNTIYNNFVQYYTHPRQEDFDTFKSNVQTILANDPDVVGVSLIGFNGRILFYSSEFQTGKYSGIDRNVEDPQTLQMIKSDQSSSRSIVVNGSDITEVVVPLGQSGGHLFSIRYLLSNATLPGKMNTVYIEITYVIIPLIIFAVVLTILFTIKLVEPITTLTKTVEKIRGGNFDIKADIKTNDEIGQLAQTFNDMTVKLKESYSILEEKVKQRTTELEHERGSLEEKVIERTGELENLKINLEKTVEDRTKTLDEKVSELERLNKLLVGRELKMVELKDELEHLKNKKE